MNPQDIILIKKIIRDPRGLQILMRNLETYYRDFEIHGAIALLRMIIPYQNFHIAVGFAQMIDYLYSRIADIVFEYEDYWGE